MDLEDERLPDLPGSHIHSTDRCDHYRSGEEIGWLCGMFPMFTNAATARAEGDDEYEEAMVGGLLRHVATARAEGRMCLHLSATGIDRSYGPRKVWRCDACGWLYRYREGDDGISHMVTAMVER